MSTFAQELNKNLEIDECDNEYYDEELQKESDNNSTIDIPQPTVTVEYKPINITPKNENLQQSKNVLPIQPIQREIQSDIPNNIQNNIPIKKKVVPIQQNQSKNKSVKFNIPNNVIDKIPTKTVSNTEKLLTTACLSTTLISTIKNKLNISTSTIYFILLLMCVGFIFVYRQYRNGDL
jgi:hypothetical protein